MERSVRLTPEAEADLTEISDYLYPFSATAARRIVLAIVSAYQSLGAFPYKGQVRDDLMPGLRRLVVENYLVFYRVEADAVVIDHILHGARDLPAFFTSPDTNAANN